MDPAIGRMNRRAFFGMAARRTVGAGMVAGGLPALLAACAKTARRGPPRAAPTTGTPIVGDVLDHALRSDEWTGDFGFVTLRLHHGLVEGSDVYFIRTDTSDEGFATSEGLVWAPKLGTLDGPGLAGEAFLVEGGVPNQAAVLSSEPGRSDYTPAWRIRRVSWSSEPRELRSTDDVSMAEKMSDVTVERTGVILNGAIVRWPGGELAVDEKRTEYHGGQLLQPPDPGSMEVMFKLHECYPGVRYIVTDHSIEPAAEMTQTVFAPSLQGGPTEAGATGRTNVFLNGLKGSGPFGFQPSVFDSQAGSPEWSPYWDHYAYKWKPSMAPALLTTETAIHDARDAGELKEYVGIPDTKGELFTVNCPVPVLAPNTYRPPAA